MIPVPQVRTPSSPGVRLVSGRLLNRLAASIQARTPLNAAQTTTAGWQGVAASAGTAAAKVGMQFDPKRNYVLSPSFLQRLREVMRARGPMAEQVQLPAQIRPTAQGLAALTRHIVRLPPEHVTAWSPPGYRMPPNTLRTAGLRIEQESRAFNGSICCLSTDYDTEEFIVAEQTVSTYTNGSITATVTASGVIHTFADDGSVEPCAPWVFADDFDPEFDYGDYLSSEYTTTRVPFSDLLDATIAGILAMTPVTVTDEYTWQEDTWRAISAPGGWSLSLSPLIWAGVSIDTPTARATSQRWRVTNTGQCRWKLDWELREYSTETLVDSGTIDLLRAGTSSWVEPPAPTSTSLTFSLSRIRLGPYL